MTLSTRETIAALRKQRKTLLDQVKAVELALQAFGALQSDAPKHTRDPGAGIECRHVALEGASTGWASALELVQDTDLSVTTMRNTCNALVAQGELVSKKERPRNTGRMTTYYKVPEA